MMLGAKGALPSTDTGLLRVLRYRDSQNIRNPLILLRKMAVCLCFDGPQGQIFSRKQACIGGLGLLNLVSITCVNYLKIHIDLRLIINSGEVQTMKRVFSHIISRFEYLVLFLFMLFVSICLFCGSLFHGDVDQTTYNEAIEYSVNNPLILRWFILLLISAFVIVNFRIWENRKACISVVCICAMVAVLFSLLFCIWNGYTPVCDQEQIWEGGIQLVYGDSTVFDKLYFDQYHNQSGAVILASLLIRISGSRNYMSWRVLNCLSVGGIVFGGAHLSWLLSRSNRAMVLTAILTTCFIPFILYSSLVYGTLVSLVFTIWSFNAALIYLEKGNKGGLIGSIVLCALANVTYSGTMITTVALIITYIVRAGVEIWQGRNGLKFFLSAAAVASVCMLCLLAAEKYFYSCTGVSDKQGIPATAYIYMGITSDDDRSVCGPGSYNSDNVNIYVDNNRNSDQTKRAANLEIKKAALDYLKGKRSLSFFAKKIRNQWADPWFSSLVMVVNYFDNNRPLKESFRTFLSGDLIGKIQTFLTSYVIVVYFFSFMHAMKIFAGRKKAISECVRSGYFLIYIYFVGGFVFYVFWEAKARYCLPYFAMLLPLASIEIMRVAAELNKFRENSNSTKKSHWIDDAG